MLRQIAEAVQDWLQGKGRDWTTCSDCNGSGALVYVRWRDGRIEDFPGRLGVIDDENMAEQWQRACPSCAGLGFDLILCARGEVRFLEVKQPGKRRQLTDSEQDAQRRYGAYWRVVTTVEEALATLEPIATLEPTP